MPGFFYIRSVFRRIFVSRPVRKFYKRQPSTMMYLRRKHKPYLFHSHLRCQMDNPLDILHRIPIPVSVSQPAVKKGCRTRPDKGHKTIIRIPCIYHCVKFRAWCFYLKTGKLFMPVGRQFQPLLFTDPRRLRITCHNLLRLCVTLHANDKRKLF